MFNVRLAGGRLCGRRLFAGLSMVVYLVASFCAETQLFVKAILV